MMFSPSNSIASTASTASSSSTCLPSRRIKCTRGPICVGQERFTSATDALVAYLKQFEAPVENGGSGSGSRPDSPGSLSSLPGNNKVKESVSTLLSSSPSQKEASEAGIKSLQGSGLVVDANGISLVGTNEDVEMLLTSKVSPQLQEEVTDAIREVKLRRLLKQAAMKSQNQTKTGLQQEVEAALLRSAQLLEKVTKEDIPSNKSLVSDVSSTPTEVLLDSSTVSVDSSDQDEKKHPSHIYSYRTSRAHRTPEASLSQSLSAPVSYITQRLSRGRHRHSSVDSLLLPPSHQLPPRGKRSSSSSSASLSNQSDPTDILRRVRSRSVSPGLRSHPGRSVAPDWVHQLDQSVRKSVPSWVGDIAKSEISESIWAPRDLLENQNNKRPTRVPSWVGEVENMDAMTGSHSLIQTMSLPDSDYPSNSRHYTAHVCNTDETSDITTDSRPGLNFSDLAMNETHTPGSHKHVTFTDSTQRAHSASPTRARQHPRHSTPLQNGLSKTPNGNSLTKIQPSKVMDSEFNGEAFLRNNILPQTAKLKKSMDNFKTSSENMRRKSISSNSSEASSGAKCSSLDTIALLSGKLTTRMDGISASPILMDSNIEPKGMGSSPNSNGQDLESSDGLDGDRSWEKLTNTFKPPVPVGENGLSHLLYNKQRSPTAGQNMESTLSGGKQPGSMETLKNMLFKLQAEETSTQEANGKIELKSNDSSHLSQPGAELIPALQDYDFQQEPGGHSLEKALVHLNRLKKLVQTTPASANGADGNKNMGGLKTSDHGAHTSSS